MTPITVNMVCPNGLDAMSVIIFRALVRPSIRNEKGPAVDSPMAARNTWKLFARICSLADTVSVMTPYCSKISV
jgi:hypothetical protein